MITVKVTKDGKEIKDMSKVKLTDDIVKIIKTSVRID